MLIRKEVFKAITEKSEAESQRSYLCKKPVLAAEE